LDFHDFTDVDFRWAVGVFCLLPYRLQFLSAVGKHLFSVNGGCSIDTTWDEKNRQKIFFLLNNKKA